MHSADKLTLLNWNIDWQSSGSRKGRAIAEIVAGADADLICLTEAFASSLTGHVITSHPDYGYEIKADRRKVVLWSRTPWEDVDDLGDPALPGGRFVAGTTTTPLGPLRVIGVCVPYELAHVATGRRDRKKWQDHRDYLEALKRILAAATGPTLVIGDFNQTIPRTRVPKPVYEVLRNTVRRPFRIITDGDITGTGRATIDHIALSHGLAAVDVQALADTADGLKLSDHFPVLATVQHAEVLSPVAA